MDFFGFCLVVSYAYMCVCVPPACEARGAHSPTINTNQGSNTLYQFDACVEESFNLFVTLLYDHCHYSFFFHLNNF